MPHSAVPWNEIHGKLASFYYRWLYDYEALRSRIAARCDGCGQEFPADLILQMPTLGLIGGNLILTDRSPTWHAMMPLSELDPKVWRCPQCQSPGLACGWIGPDSERYRFRSFLHGAGVNPADLLGPSQDDWRFLGLRESEGFSPSQQPLAFSPTADVIGIPGYFSLGLWDPISGHTINLEYDESDRYCDVVRILYGPGGEQIAVVGCGFEGETTVHTTWVRLWRERVHQWHQRWLSGWPRSADVSPDGRVLAIGTEDGSVCLLNLDDGSFVAEQRAAHTKAVLSVSFSPSGRRIFTCGEDGLRAWNPELADATILTQEAVHQVIRIPVKGTALTLGENTNSYWDMDTAKLVRQHDSLEWPTLLGFTDRVAATPDGRTLAWNAGSLQLWDIDLDSRACAVDLKEQGEDAEVRAFSSGGGLLALAHSFAGHTLVWSVGLISGD
jgi:WD40 repeat protein